jgi:hypothetical protein
MCSRRPTWLVLIVLHATACFGEPPTVGDTDTGSAADTTGGTGQSESEPVIGESGDPSATSVASASADDGDPETGSGEDGSDSTGAEGGTGTTGHSSSDEGSSSDTSSGASTTGEPVWTCDIGFYDGNDGCDCGCGIFDPDCADATVDACEYCSNEGSCSFDLNCPGYIDPDNNAICN